MAVSSDVVTLNEEMVEEGVDEGVLDGRKVLEKVITDEGGKGVDEVLGMVVSFSSDLSTTGIVVGSLDDKVVADPASETFDRPGDTLVTSVTKSVTKETRVVKMLG